MNNYFKYVFFAFVILLTAVGFFLLNSENAIVPEVSLDKTKVNGHQKLNTPNNAKANDNVVLTKTLADIQKQLVELKTDVTELKSSKYQDGQNSPDDANWSNLFEEIRIDPQKQEKINEFVKSEILKDYERTETYFASLEVDEAWSNDAQSYLDNAVVTASESSGVRNGQFSTSECKGGMCKISFQAPISVQSDGKLIEQNEFEHDFLVSMGKKFPRSRITTKKIGNSFVVEGFISDSNTSMPSGLSDLQRSGITIDQVRAIIQSQN